MSEEKKKLQKYETLLRSSDIMIYEYHPDTDIAIKLDQSLNEVDRIENYMSQIDSRGWIKSCDMDRYVQFIRGLSDGSIEIESASSDNGRMLNRIRKMYISDGETGEEYLLLSKKDITFQKSLENKYREQAQHDSMTQLYNRVSGKELIGDYLKHKTPYEACAMMVMDVDYFKGVNDSYGHLFGDKVLISVASLLMRHFGEDSIVSRIGGDEFAVFVKNTENKSIIARTDDFIKAVRKLTYEENDYTPTCSIGVCFVSENVPHSSYDQIFGNADWALYQAKRQGRNRYVFCDNLHRFEEDIMEKADIPSQIDARYFQNDILATAFEVFEKSTSYNEAMELMLHIIGIRFQLDRISVIRGDLAEEKCWYLFKWCKDGMQDVSGKEFTFSKDGFLKFYREYDEYNTIVLNYDHMDKFSEKSHEILMPDGAKTILYVAAYLEGEYRGVVSFVTTGQKRFWSMDKRRELSEVVKLFSAYRKRYIGVNKCDCGSMNASDYDNLTGLLSFSRFRDDVERVIVRKTALPHIMVYSDIENFTEYNKIYGYEKGDFLLKEFANYIIGTMTKQEETYFSRIVSDQFILFMPYDVNIPDMDYKVKRLNDAFIRSIVGDENPTGVRIRTGIYRITDECTHVTEAIDAANLARKQIKADDEMNVVIYGGSHS